MQILKTNFVFAKPLIPLVLDNIKYIIIHHPDAVIASPQQIHQWHLENGWSGFGYNEYIRKDGTVYIGRGDYIGAQCQNYNSVSYGICAEGDYDQETQMPQAQFLSIVERIKFHRTRFKNYQKTVAHRDLGQTTCPGKYFPMDKILNEIEGDKMSIEDAMKILVDKGVISNPDYWIKVVSVVKFFDALLINMASKLN